MKHLDSEEEEVVEPLGQRQTELRQWANRRMQQLSSDSEQLNPEEEVETNEGRNSNGNIIITTMSEEDKAPWSQKSQSEAVNQLKSLLLKQCKDIPPSLSPSEQPSPSKRVQLERGPSFSAFKDLVPMVHNQSEYIQHLEAEVKFCKEELQGLKQRIRVVVVENEKLHSQLRAKAADESLKDYTIRNSTMNESRFISNTSHNEHKTWKNELEQLKVIHQAQVDSLEAQIIALRRALSVSEKEYEDLKTHLKRKEKQVENALRTDGAPHVAGMCLKCAQSEAVLAGTHTNLHIQAIDRLTKERDELMGALHSIRTSQKEALQREWSACLQVKQAVEMAEETKLQKATVEVLCEQLSRELAHQRELSDQEAHILKQKLAAARDEGRSESRKQKQELAVSVSNLSQRIAELKGQLDKTQRNNSSLTNELEDTLRKLTSQEQDNTKVCVDLRYQINNAKLQKEEAERELREVKAKTRTHMEKTAQEVERLSSELVGCRQHLEMVQKDGSQWQAEVLSLAEQLANAQRQLHLTRQEKESEEQAHQETLASVSLSAQQREQELSVMVQRTEAQHLQRVGELDILLSSQHKLIGKLNEECCNLGVKLEELTEHSRNELGHLTLEKLHLEEVVKSLRSRCSHMEEECVQHDRMHQRMKDRLQQLDRHCQSSSQQVCELLAKQNQLMKERNALSEEMQNLLSKLPNMRETEALLT
ncbi:serologically defined colon cancer antigen 8 homolog [Gouania willdenowi]|uniref:Serologically defined colon cancer antigen 8 n=1 Tax=Gouania willdenowi TaxID=441366 RepID=A0A8C5HDZ6_GOUWI|nr:serologically defined colon cancer antigen 8 [Gouania willdenowi]XP_028324994.1 serologically defined colon cancer antigen 8 [Gouania willdenowi]